MEDLYSRLFPAVGPDSEDSSVGLQDEDLSGLQRDLERYFQTSGRCVGSEALREYKQHLRPGDGGKLEEATLQTIWNTAVLAWKAGWPTVVGADVDLPHPLTSQSEQPLEITDIPEAYVEILAGGWYKWRGFKK